MNYKITGHDAIRLAERDSLQLRCYANPIDDGGPVSIEVARQIAKDDPSLLYVTVTPSGWWDGRRVEYIHGYDPSDYFNSSGMYLGPDVNGVEPTWDDSPEMNTYTYGTDSGGGKITAESLESAYEIARQKITAAMVADGATLWVESEAGERITMGVDAD